MRNSDFRIYPSQSQCGISTWFSAEKSETASGETSFDGRLEQTASSRWCQTPLPGFGDISSNAGLLREMVHSSVWSRIVPSAQTWAFALIEGHWGGLERKTSRPPEQRGRTVACFSASRPRVPTGCEPASSCLLATSAHARRASDRYMHVNVSVWPVTRTRDMRHMCDTSFWVMCDNSRLCFALMARTRLSPRVHDYAGQAAAAS